MKILFAFLLTLFALFTVNARTPSLPEEESDTNFVVEVIAGGVGRVARYHGTSTEITISSRIKNMTVVAIGKRAFYGKGLTSVIIHNSIVLIEEAAFLDNEITRITIGAGVTCHENSFDSGFAAFYTENGQRGGTYIYKDGSWVRQTDVSSPPPVTTPDKDTTPPSTKEFGIETYGGFFLGFGYWDYGPSLLNPKIGFSLGLLFNLNSFKIGFSGEGGVFASVALPYFEDIGIAHGYYFGSFMDFFIFDNYSFSIGGGMTKGYLNTQKDRMENYFIPFAELDIMAGDREDESIALYFRYYFEDSDKWYNKFAIGIKFIYGW